MEAVLVIDVDREELGEAVATITANDITFFARGFIKSLPEKKEMITDLSQLTDSVSGKIARAFIKGYNACIDEIEG